ncbi:MAG: sensor histidine kinase [Bryobacteraceae bacterium]
MDYADKSRPESLEALRRIRAHWLSNVTHDFRGPLFAARGYTKLMLEERGGNVTVTQRKYLNNILEHINKLATLVNSLQEFPSDHALQLEVVSWTELLRAALQDWRRREKTLQFEDDLPGVPVHSTGDRAKLSFAVHKLLGTVVEFSRSGGKVEVCARQEEDQLMLRFSGILKGLRSGSPIPSQADIAMPCEIVRLHGGMTFFETENPEIRRVTCRLPIIR